jgi:Ca2+-binding RTX toxin-like protein
MKLKRYLMLLGMLVAVGIFFAGLTIARADSGGNQSDDPTPTCQLPGNDQGDDDAQGDENDQGEDVQGDEQDDNIQGTAGDDQLDGNQGDDDIHGEAGDDDICGDQGDDDLAGNAGNDVVLGGSGNDTINVRHHGLDKVRCGGGHDVVKASRNDKVASNCEVVKY